MVPHPYDTVVHGGVGQVHLAYEAKFRARGWSEREMWVLNCGHVVVLQPGNSLYKMSADEFVAGRLIAPFYPRSALCQECFGEAV